MAALTEAQLQARCRAKFPITVVRDEDYTVLTPAQIAAAWTGYVGGSENIYMENLAGMWVEMDPDLPKANGRGLLVFGGGKQYERDCTYSACTVAGSLVDASWYFWKNASQTATFTAKGTAANGLPYAEFEIDGEAGYCYQTSLPGWLIIPHADIAVGDVVTWRSHVDVQQAPPGITTYRSYLYQQSQVGESDDNTNPISTQIVENSFQIGTGNDDDNVVRFIHTILSAGQNWIVRFQPWLTSVNTAFPDHFTVVNTSTSSAATIVPEIMQRPWEYEGPWSVESEVELAPRLNGTSVYLLAGGEGWTDGFGLVQDANGLYAFQRRDNGSIFASGYIEADPGDTVKFVFYQTAQVTKLFANGASVYDGVGGREKDGVFSIGHHWTGGQHAFATFKSLVYRKGLATDAQLEEWSTAA